MLRDIADKSKHLESLYEFQLDRKLRQILVPIPIAVFVDSMLTLLLNRVGILHSKEPEPRKPLRYIGRVEMITYLQVPYDEKDWVKKLGARWDMARKSWYIENVEDITRFMRWIPVKQKKEPLKEKVKHEKKHHKPAITGPSVFAPLCECAVLPWDDCEHTERLAHNAMKEMLA